MNNYLEIGNDILKIIKTQRDEIEKELCDCFDKMSEGYKTGLSLDELHNEISKAMNLTQGLKAINMAIDKVTGLIMSKATGNE
jgi:hypothetical protein